MEKRKYHRISFNVPVILKKNDQQWETEVIDISLKGLLVKNPQKVAFKNEELISVEFILTDNKTKVSLDATVAHIEDNSIGFNMETISLESFTHLKRILELNSADETLLQRELATLILNQD